MERANEIRQEGRGRAGHLVLTEQGRDWNATAARLISFAFAQDAGEVPWDGNWHIYTFNVPESHRKERDALRTALTKLGAAALSPGTYLSAHQLYDELSAILPSQLADDRLVQATARHLQVPDCTNSLDIAERFWPSATVLSAYDQLDAHLSDTSGQSIEDFMAVVAAALQLVQLFGLALEADPLLPPELRPADWPPKTVRARFAVEWTSLRRRAPHAPIFQELATFRTDTA